MALTLPDLTDPIFAGMPEGAIASEWYVRHTPFTNPSGIKVVNGKQLSPVMSISEVPGGPIRGDMTANGLFNAGLYMPSADEKNAISNYRAQLAASQSSSGGLFGNSFLGGLANSVVGLVNDLGPVGTIATAVLAPEFLPAVAAAQTAAKGGDLSDIAKAAATSYAVGTIGQQAGILGDQASAAAQYGTDLGSQQTAMLAAQEAGMGTVGDVAGNIAGKAASSAASSALTGAKTDPLATLTNMGASAAAPLITSQIEGFDTLPSAAQKAINTVVASEMTGKDPTNALIAQALQAGKNAYQSYSSGTAAPADTSSTTLPISAQDPFAYTPQEDTSATPTPTPTPTPAPVDTGTTTLPISAQDPFAYTPQEDTSVQNPFAPTDSGPAITSPVTDQTSITPTPIPPVDTGATQGPTMDDELTPANPLDFGAVDTGDQITPANPADFGATSDVIAPPEPSGPGYYDEITGEWISDPNGALTGPIDPSQSGNIESMDGWTADPKTGIWTDPSGTQYQSTPWDPTAAGTSGDKLSSYAKAVAAKNAASATKTPTTGGTKTPTGTGLTTAGLLAGLGGITGLLALMKSDSARYGTPGRQDYAGPLSQFKFNPSLYQASAPNPAMFRPQGGVTTVADQLAAQQAQAQQAPQIAASPIAQLAPRPDVSPDSPMAQMLTMARGDRAQDQAQSQVLPDGQMAQMAQMASGGSTSKKPQYTAKPKLASMDPWARAAAEYENAAYRAQSPVAPTAAPVGPQLGQLNLRSGGELGSYSDGGHMLKGPGDGMSDSIPATIGGKRPARLADGEFVVPADVVSHLGNGSTEAGARELYRMMDKVRQARTGNKKQGKQINPGKFLPK